MTHMALDIQIPAPDVWLLRGGRSDSNCYYLPRHKILIEAGLAKTGSKIATYLEKEGLRLDWLILTHADVDHVGGARTLADATGAFIACHEDEAPYLRQGKPRPFGRSLQGRVIAALAATQSRFAKATEPVTVSRELNEGDQIGELQVLHLPGHSPGSIGLYQPSTGYLFAGDAILTQGALTASADTSENPDILPFSYPAKSFRYDSVLAYRSLERLLRLDITGVFPGHGEPYVRGTQTVRRGLERLLGSPY